MADAEAHLVRAVELEPDNLSALRNLASVYAATEQFPQALEELLRIDAIQRDDPAIVYGLGIFYRALGRPTEATESFRRCVGLADAFYAELARGHLREMAEESFQSSGLRMDAVQFCYDALTKFDAMSDDVVEAIVGEIGLLGRRGIDTHDLEPKYALRAADGRFSGLQLMCFLYVGMKRVAPGQDLVHDYTDPAIVELDKRLAAVLEEPDTGFEGDVRESNQWAEIIGISDWFGWQAFEDMPASYLA